MSDFNTLYFDWTVYSLDNYYPPIKHTLETPIFIAINNANKETNLRKEPSEN